MKALTEVTLELTEVAAIEAIEAWTSAADAALETTLTAEARLLISLERAFETTEAAFEAALATESAFDAAVETILAALLAALATERALLAAVETMETALETVLIATALTEISFDRALLRTLTACERAE